MPLQQLVEYFNDRFQTEYQSIFRPFIYKNAKVSGLFGPIKIDTHFLPLRQNYNPTNIIGHLAQIEVSNHGIQPVFEHANEACLPASETDSVTSFDRLSRTVHMLNYLKHLPVYNTLFLEVNPLHVLEVKKDHGVYFHDIIATCGLAANNIVIVLQINKQYSKFFNELASGLSNYRQQGYQTALRIEYPNDHKSTLALIAKLSPNFVMVSAKHFEFDNEALLADQLNVITQAATIGNGQSLLQHIDQKKFDTLARIANFNLVEGSYYRSIAFDYKGRVEQILNNENDGTRRVFN